MHGQRSVGIYYGIGGSRSEGNLRYNVRIASEIRQFSSDGYAYRGKWDDGGGHRIGAGGNAPHYGASKNGFYFFGDGSNRQSSGEMALYVRWKNKSPVSDPGRGWGQGPQHSQNIQAWFAHVPGLHVVTPTSPYDAKGLLITSIEDNNPVVFIEHRWLHNTIGNVPEGIYRIPLGQARLARPGKDVSIVAMSYMTIEALRAAEMLDKDGIHAEVIDLRTLKPLDEDTILESVCKTGRLIVLDIGWKTGGVGAEIVARITERAFANLKYAPRRIGLPDCPTPTTPALANYYYPRAPQIVSVARAMLGRDPLDEVLEEPLSVPLDVPDKFFTGPF